jgi:hypothetical protein
MFAGLKAAAGRVFGTKLGIALVGALVVGGGGTAMAMTGAPASLIPDFAAASPTAHSGAASAAGQLHAGATATGQDDQDEQGEDDASCAGTPGATGADSDDSSTATTTAGQGGQEGSEHEGTATAGDDHDAECTGTPSASHTPGSDDGPEGTHTPQGTQGPGGD